MEGKTNVEDTGKFEITAKDYKGKNFVLELKKLIHVPN